MERLTADFETDTARRRLRMTRLRATAYGGTLVGQGTADLSETGGYRLQLTLHDAQVQPVLEPDTSAVDAADAATQPLLPPVARFAMPPAQSSERGMDSGLLSGSLIIADAYEGPVEALRGRARVSIREASLYDSPISLAMLQAINLNFPLFAQPFDKASIDILINGNTAWIDHALIESPTLALTGEGKLALDTQALELYLVTDNPKTAEIRARAGLLASLRNQIFGVRIGGTLEDPKAEVVALPVLQELRGLIPGSR